MSEVEPSSPDTPQPRKGILSRLTGAVTGRVVESIDPDVVVDHLDVNALLARVDVDRLLSRVDVNTLLDRVDVDRLLDRVDVNRLLDRVDVDRITARVDVERLLVGSDLEALARRAGIPEIVAESTGRVAGSALDLLRRQVAGLDVVIDHLVNRVLGRDPAQQPSGPPSLVGPMP
jgi:hypothetical protein